MSNFKPLRAGLLKFYMDYKRYSSYASAYYYCFLWSRSSFWMGFNGTLQCGYCLLLLLIIPATFPEIYRGGIESIPKGQQEAGLVLGMTKPQIFLRLLFFRLSKELFLL